MDITGVGIQHAMSYNTKGKLAAISAEHLQLIYLLSNRIIDELINEPPNFVFMIILLLTKK